MPKCDFNKAANHTSAWVFSCKFAAYFQSNFSKEHVWVAASDTFCFTMFGLYIWMRMILMIHIQKFEKILRITVSFKNSERSKRNELLSTENEYWLTVRTSVSFSCSFFLEIIKKSCFCGGNHGKGIKVLLSRLNLPNINRESLNDVFVSHHWNATWRPSKTIWGCHNVKPSFRKNIVVLKNAISICYFNLIFLAQDSFLKTLFLTNLVRMSDCWLTH